MSFSEHKLTGIGRGRSGWRNEWVEEEERERSKMRKNS